MNIFKIIQNNLDLNKKIKEEEKHLKNKKDETYSKILDECIDFSYEFFNKNLINDFKNLEKIYKTNLPPSENIKKEHEHLRGVSFTNKKHYQGLSIREVISYPVYESISLDINLGAELPDKELELSKLKKFKISIKNLNLTVNTRISGRLDTFNFKSFSITKKERAYTHFNFLFKEEILKFK
jgi:hypothetical protein